MNKKLFVVSTLAVFILVAISFASAVSSNTALGEKKESPLFGIRTRKAIGDRLQNLRENIKARFIGERVFFLPFQLLNNEDTPSARNMLGRKTIIFSCPNPCTGMYHALGNRANLPVRNRLALKTGMPTCPESTLGACTMCSPNCR